MLEEMRVHFGYKLKQEKAQDAIPQIDTLLNDVTKSPILSDFLYLMDYNDGSDLGTYEDFLQNYDETANPEVKYEMHTDRLDRAIELTNKLVAAITDIKQRVQ